MRPKRRCTESVNYQAPPAEDSDSENEVDAGTDASDSDDEFGQQLEKGKKAHNPSEKTTITRKTALGGTRTDPAPYWKEITVTSRKPWRQRAISQTVPNSAFPTAPSTHSVDGYTKSVTAKSDSEQDEDSQDDGDENCDDEDDDLPRNAKRANDTSRLEQYLSENGLVTTVKKIKVQPRVWQDLPKWGKKKKCPLFRLPSEVLDIIIADSTLSLYDHLSLSVVSKGFLNAYTDDVWKHLLVCYPPTLPSDGRGIRRHSLWRDRRYGNRDKHLDDDELLQLKNSESIVKNIISRAPALNANDKIDETADLSDLSDLDEDVTLVDVDTKSAVDGSTNPEASNGGRARSSRHAARAAATKLHTMHEEENAFDKRLTEIEEAEKPELVKYTASGYRKRKRGKGVAVSTEPPKAIVLSPYHMQAIAQNSNDRIAKENVKYQWRLSDAELNALTPLVNIRDDPKFPTKGRLKLYRVSDIEQLAMRAHGGLVGHAAYMATLEDKRARARSQFNEYSFTMDSECECEYAKAGKMRQGNKKT